MSLDERLKALLDPLGAESKRMFGGTCFMINGNMVIGTLKDGLIVRVGKENHAAAMKRPGARVFDMTGRPMQGFIGVAAATIASDRALEEWIDLGLSYVKQLPPKQAKAPKPPRKAKTSKR